MAQSINLNVKSIPFIVKNTEKLPSTSQHGNQVQEVLLYEKLEDDGLYNFPNLCIKNYISKTGIRTVAEYILNGNKIEVNSDEITECIGQMNYETLIYALINSRASIAKIQGIMAMLKRSKPDKLKGRVNRHIQTDDSFIQEYKQIGIKRKKFLLCKDAGVQDDSLSSHPQKKVKVEMGQKENTQYGELEASEEFIDTKFFIEEDSNISDRSFESWSLKTYQIPDIVEDPFPILNNIEKYTREQTTKKFRLKLIDGTTVALHEKPKDIFHIATPANLKDLSVEERKKITIHQAYMDWRYCLSTTEDGDLPLHEAVMENDLALIHRHCVLIKNHGESIDKLGALDLSPLQLSVKCNFAQAMEVLLSHGARLMQVDKHSNTILHLAAGSNVDTVLAILGYCQKHAERILMQEGEWSESKRSATEDPSSYLIHKLCTMFNNNGHTALMVGAARGDAGAVRALCEAGAVHARAPTSGSTAMLLALEHAVAEAHKNGVFSGLHQHYLETLEILSEYGADPNVRNYSGASVSSLMAEFKLDHLAAVLASKVLKHAPLTSTFGTTMLVRDKDGDIKLEAIDNRPKQNLKLNQKSKHPDNTPKQNNRNEKSQKPRVVKPLKKFVKAKTLEPKSSVNVADKKVLFNKKIHTVSPDSVANIQVNVEKVGTSKKPSTLNASRPIIFVKRIENGKFQLVKGDATPLITKSNVITDKDSNKKLKIVKIIQ